MMETRDVKLERSTFYKQGVEIDFTNDAAIRQYALTCSKILRLLHDIYQNQENWGCFRTKCIANLLPHGYKIYIYIYNFCSSFQIVFGKR